LFDIGLTGGPEWTGFTHVNLNHPLPNPVFEDSIRKVLGLTEGQLEDVIAGKRMLKEKTGPEALRSALQSLNVHSEIDRLKDLVTNGSKTNRDDAIKRLRVFTMLKKTGIKPEELMLTKVPIMPPQYRPIATGPKGMTIVSDPNYLYKEIIRANNNVKDVTDTLGHEAAGDERLALYSSFKALVGLSDPLQPKLQEKNIKGILSHALGLRSSPKFSVFQRKIIGSTTDMVGSAVITPNPSLDMDQVGLPEEKAWTLYRPFIIRSLVRRGTPAVQAVNMVANKDRIAKDALIEEMKVRPVLINRAPTLHKFGIMAAWPVLAKTQTMQLSPTIVSGYGADFDGDRMQFHVPVSDEAVSEAKRKLMPSANLLSARNFDVHYAPIQEFLHGLFRATHDQSAHEAKTFATKADAIAAFRRGEINADTRIKILQG
jgi:DNA-directed RNA polymerase subunit beta'